MKSIKQISRRLAVGCVLAFSLVTNIHAQPVPPTSTNDPPSGTNTYDLTAYYSNNLASVAQWLHASITNSDGSAVSSVQNMLDSQITAFASSNTFGWQQSARDEALTWATANGLPTQLEGPDGSYAHLVGREDGVPTYIMPFDLASAVTINTTNVWPGGPTAFNLNGTNTTLSMWDEASPRLTHSEFGSRVTELDGVTNLSGHSTAVAGILAASGVNVVYSNGVPLTNAAKGMSYTAQVQARDFFGDLGEMSGALGTNQMRLSNHSYGAVAGWYQDAYGTWYWFGYAQIGSQDPRFGNYTTNASGYDLIAHNAPTYLSVWAAGNDQAQGPPVQPTNHYEFTLAGQYFVTNAVRSADGDQGGFDTMSQQASAKNILSVGAVNALTSGYAGPTNLVLASFSSCGPTDDGRIKPDVVGDGVNNIVPTSGSDYAFAIGSGTSFASPSVAGSVNLLAQFYKQHHTNAAEPLASTIKGLVIQTADSGTTNAGPSYRFGWGLMNTRTAATVINNDATNGLKNQIKEVLLPNGQNILFPVVSAGTNTLKVTICWTDPVGVPNAVTNLNNYGSKLVNDLDLRVFAPDGTTNFPWVLDPDLTNRTSAARSAVASKGDDSRNNVEQVYIPNPTNGTYTVQVTHKGSLQSNAVQWVSILLSGNVAQQPPQFSINQMTQTGTNALAIGWPSVVGANYQVKTLDVLGTTNWVNVGGLINARLTNIVTQVPYNPTNRAQFYRVIQVN